MSDDKERKKPGRKPETLVIEGDPEEALDHLLNPKKPTDKKSETD